MIAKENEQTRDASDDELGEFLGDLFKSHRQLMARRQRSDDEAQQFLEELLSSFSSSHRQTKRRITDDEDPVAKRLAESTTVASSREEATPVASSHEEASTPSTKNHPTMSERADAAPQLPGVPVPTGVLWCFCSFDACLAVETVVQRVKRRVEIRFAHFKPACFKIGIACDPEIRFHHRAGYISEGYAFMVVLWRSTPANCVAVETISVDYYIDEAGCQNLSGGGGGVNAKRDDYQQHVYVAFMPISFLDKFRSERVSRAPSWPLGHRLHPDPGALQHRRPRAVLRASRQAVNRQAAGG